MKTVQRYLYRQIQSDLEKKMVFLGGPRQVGKTTLARQILQKTHQEKGYLNWDIPRQREHILKEEWPVSKIWVLDEIHKYRSWRNLLKGLYDQYGGNKKILVTGSARLDFYRRGGDSLQGRYHYLRLHPLSVAELKIKSKKAFLDLLNLGGFPEPFFEQSETAAKRWSREYRSRLIEDDLISLERVQDLGHLELLMLRLPELVGSPLSIHALQEDLQVSHKTISNWLQILERLYNVFRLAPFGASHLRAVKKEQKHYHFDWTLIGNEALRFENLVAAHLLKWVHFEQDTKGKDVELRYFRDVDGRELDFIICKTKHRGLEPLMAIECKWEDAEISRSLKYFKARFPACEAWQISAIGEKDYLSREGIRVCPSLLFLQKLI